MWTTPDGPAPRRARTLMPRAERAAVVLLEVCAFNLVEAIVAVLLARDAHERDAA
jgi:hypothetical protein